MSMAVTTWSTELELRREGELKEFYFETKKGMKIKRENFNEWVKRHYERMWIKSIETPHHLFLQTEEYKDQVAYTIYNMDRNRYPGDTRIRHNKQIFRVRWPFAFLNKYCCKCGVVSTIAHKLFMCNKTKEKDWLHERVIQKLIRHRKEQKASNCHMFQGKFPNTNFKMDYLEIDWDRRVVNIIEVGVFAAITKGIKYGYEKTHPRRDVIRAIKCPQLVGMTKRDKYLEVITEYEKKGFKVELNYISIPVQNFWCKENEFALQTLGMTEEEIIKFKREVFQDTTKFVTYRMGIGEMNSGWEKGKCTSEERRYGNLVMENNQRVKNQWERRNKNATQELGSKA